MARALLNDSVIEKVASLALGCCVAGGVLTLSTAAAPVVGGAVSLTAVLTTLGLKRLIRDKPECEKALTSIKRALAKDFIQGGDADEASVRSAMLAFDAALKPEAVFTAEALTEALAAEARVVPALTGHVLADMAARDPRFEEAGLARDLAEQILTEAFKRSIEACPPFKDRANLVLAEVTLDEVRGLGEQMAVGFGGLHDHLERLEALMRGEDSPAIRKLRAELNVRMDELGIPEHERPAWLAVWVDEVIAAFDERRGSTNEGAAFDALRDRALELLLSNPDEAASPFLDELARESAEEQDRQQERHRRRERLWEEAVEMEMLALRFDAAVATLWRQAAEQASDEEGQAGWLANRAVHLAKQAEVHPGLSRLLLVEAVYRSLLQDSIREVMPSRWTVLQTNLGAALRTLGERAGGDAGVKALIEAVAAHRSVLEVCTRRDMPVQWAAAQNNLGTALQTLGDRNGGNALNEAVEAYRAALQVRTRARLPAEWAMTQINLGTALQIIGTRTGQEAGVDALNQSVLAYHAALDVYTRADKPDLWAMAQNNLGNTLRALGEGAEGPADIKALSESVKAYRAALEVRTRASMPADWAMTQNNLGNALHALGKKYRSKSRPGAERKALQQSVKAYREALKVITRPDMPAHWASVQNNLGSALLSLSEQAENRRGETALNGAVEAYRASLQVFTRANMPVQWALAQANLGEALAAVARTSGDPAVACQAVEVLASAIFELETAKVYAWAKMARDARADLIQTCRSLGGTCAD